MNRHNIFVGLVGVSGVGKSTIAKHLEEHQGFSRLPSYTTRPPRAGDLDGELQFVNDQRYDQLDKAGEFLEQAAHGEYRYALRKPGGPGPHVSPINGDGIRYLRKHQDEHGLHIVPVGIIPPDMTTLLARNQGMSGFEARAARDHFHGVRLPPDLINTRYDMILVNHRVEHTAMQIGLLVDTLVHVD